MMKEIVIKEIIKFKRWIRLELMIMEKINMIWICNGGLIKFMKKLSLLNNMMK